MGEAMGPGGAVVLRWSRHPRCVGMARAELRGVLGEWGLSALADRAVLVLSELLTNAGRHARVPQGREIETRFSRVGGGSGGVRVEVHDASVRPPQEWRPDLDAEDGRGLLLVAAVADRWGFGDRSGPGKVVWVELVRPPAADGGGAMR